MNILGFEVEHNQTYTILRDYYIQTKAYKGIMFVLLNEESGEVFHRILPMDEANNMYLWEKLKKGEIKYQTSGMESGNGRSRLIVETGILVLETGISKKEKRVPAKKFRYQLG